MRDVEEYLATKASGLESLHWLKVSPTPHHWLLGSWEGTGTPTAPVLFHILISRCPLIEAIAGPVPPRGMLRIMD